MDKINRVDISGLITANPELLNLFLNKQNISSNVKKNKWSQQAAHFNASMHTEKNKKTL